MGIPYRVFLKIAYWLLVALIPFLPIYLNDRVQERVNCSLANGCLQRAMPFIAEMGIACAIAGFILWPMCLWQLGGRWLWGRVLDMRRRQRV
jgi:hypothetical protein